MKKKLIQILMLLVVAVSIGAFVSCKDTNEDLYNELRYQTSVSDQTLTDRLATLQAELDALKASTGNCMCDKNLRTDLNAVMAQLAGLNLTTNPDGTIDLGGATIGGSGGGGVGGSLGDLINDLYDKLTDEDGKPIDLDELWNAVNGNTNAIDDINDALGNQAKDILDLISGVAGHTTAITDITNTLNEYHTNITDLQAGQEAANGLIAELQSQLEDLKNQCKCEDKWTDIWMRVTALDSRTSFGFSKG